MRVLEPPRSIRTAPGHFLGIPALMVHVSNDVVVALSPWELGDLDGSCLLAHTSHKGGGGAGGGSKPVSQQAESMEISELPGGWGDHRIIRNMKHKCWDA